MFQHLNVQDLSGVADVCVRFRQNAQATFITKYKHKVEIKDTVGVADEFEAILRNFGQSLHFLEISSGLHGINDIETLQMVNQHATALQSLTLYRFALTEDMINVRAVFENLYSLSLIYCDLQKGGEKLLSECTELKALRMYGNDCEDNGISITFSKLEEVFLHPYYDEDGEIQVKKFIAVNSTLKRLKLGYSTRYEFRCDAIDMIREHLYSLGHVKIGNIFRHRNAQKEQFEKCVKHLDRWDSLQMLQLPLDGFGTLLLNEFAKINLPIECLSHSCVEIARAIEKHRGESYLTRFDLPEDYVIDLVNKLPQMEELDLLYRITSNITAAGIQKIIESSKKLSYLGIYNARNIQIEMDDYQMMLNAVQNRGTKIPLSICLGNEVEPNVPAESLLANRKWLKFSKFSRVLDIHG